MTDQQQQQPDTRPVWDVLITVGDSTTGSSDLTRATTPMRAALNVAIGHHGTSVALTDLGDNRFLMTGTRVVFTVRPAPERLARRFRG